MLLFGLPNCEKSCAYKLRCNCPAYVVRKLKKVGRRWVALKNELMVLHGSEELRAKSRNVVLQRLHDSSRVTTFAQMYKLECVICSIPATTASDEWSFSAFRRIKTYLLSTHSRDRLS
jgi:hypothetical protein